MTGVTSNLIRTVAFTGHRLSGVRHGVFESKRYDWFFRTPQSKPTTSESCSHQFHSESSSSPCFHYTWPGKTNQSTQPQQQHPSFTSLWILPATGSLETSSLWWTTSSANGTPARVVSLSSPGITPHSDREDETPLGLMWACQQQLGLLASVFRGKRDPTDRWRQNLEPEKPRSFCDFTQSIIPDDELKETNKHDIYYDPIMTCCVFICACSKWPGLCRLPAVTGSP